MGFLSSSVRDELQREDDDKKKKNKSILDRAKESLGDFVDHPSEIPGKVARGVFGNSAKFVNQAYQEGKQVVNTGKMLTAQATGNDVAFQHANEQSHKDYKGFKTKGGLFGAGTFTTEDDAKKGELETGLKKIGGGTVGVATEVVPYARGATLARAGGSTAENLGRSVAEGAGYGVVGSAAQQEAENGRIDPKQVAIGALMGGATGGLGFAADKGIDKALTKSKAVNDKLGEGGFVGHSDEASPTNPQYPKQANLADVDTRTTSPADAQSTIAQTAMDIKPVNKAKAALTGTDKSGNTTEVGKGASSIAEKLDQQLQEFDKSLATPESIKQHLINNNAVSRDARKHKSLDRFEDTLSVLGRHFGQVGTDFGYKLAEGAKKRSDMYEAIQPSIKEFGDAVKKIKSEAGRKDVGDRLNDALQDRDNLLSYAKTPEEKKLFQSVADVFNYFEVQRANMGLTNLNDYSPRVKMRNALEAPDRMMDDVKTAVGDVKSRFSKRRIKQDVEDDLNTNILDIFPEYVSSMSKDLSYRGAMDYLASNAQSVNPAYLTNRKDYREGVNYLQRLMSDTLEMSPSKHKVQDKLIANTYGNQLRFNFKVAAQNMGQRIAVKSQVSKKANNLVRFKKIDQADLDSLHEGNMFTNNPITDELDTSPGAKTKKLINKLDPFQATERGNVRYAYDRGVTQGVIDSEPYKAAIKNGLKPKEAFKTAIQDPTVKEAAIRRGNMVVNDTQFGANAVTKSEFFRDNKSAIPFLSDKWYKQYQRYPHGMAQHLSTILRANDARALDVLKNGNPAETKLVDYLYSAQSMSNGVDDIIKGIKNKEISDVSLEVAKGYKKALDNSIDTLNKEIKNHSQLRGGKTAKNAAKMWAAASAIQFLFDGGFAMNQDDQNKEIAKSVTYGSPVNIPTKNNDYLLGLGIPANPIGTQGIRPEKLTNFIPGVGLVVNRGREITKFVKALTGD